MRKLKNYVKGSWIEPETEEYLDVENPSTGETVSLVPLCTAGEANPAIEAADEAFPEWSGMPVARRVGYLFRFLQLVQENADRVSRVLVEEMGKSLIDAQAEMKRLIENVQVACGMPVMQQGDKVVGCSFGIDGEVIRLPLGVFTMIAPFNFPAMVPFWFIPYALATGNTYVVKPSEQVPNTMNLITEYVDEAGFPPGVFNLVNGGPAVAEAFMDSPLVKGISMVGSTRVCRIIAERCARSNKRFQALGSAKNHLVVMPDAKMDDVIRNMITSCFGCAGQRCMAASAIICVGEKTYRRVSEGFVQAAKALIMANPLDDRYIQEPVLVGPVISRRAKERIEKLIEEGVREGATLALDGRGAKVEGFERGHFIGPSVFTDVKPGMQIHRTEIFGPVVVILHAATLDEAIGIINDHEYGNGASLYTQNGYYARKFKLETQCGMIGINVGIPAPVAYLPFGGMKSSIFADIKAQGKAIVHFFTEDKIVTERYWPEE
jgi:malonate-semialdehyde dehydrogenase (acetylating)/methylmalonate-semialdehyde dehydrogenase